MSEEYSLDKYLEQVINRARELGYDERQILNFLPDILECYYGGVSVENCVEEQF